MAEIVDIASNGDNAHGYLALVWSPALQPPLTPGATTSDGSGVFDAFDSDLADFEDGLQQVEEPIPRPHSRPIRSLDGSDIPQGDDAGEAWV